MHFHAGLSTFSCYLSKPELTSQVFVTIDNQVYLKTGDLARYNTRGELVSVGRIDFQVKIRGQRVETTEIESTIMSWQSSDGVKGEIVDCLVLKLLSNEDSLIAYIVSPNSELDTNSIRAYCQKHLRQFMIPTHFIVLDKMPLNTNGKVDRQALPRPTYAEAYHNIIEHESLSDKVCQLWCSRLHLDHITADDTTSCFALGGSSLTLMQFFNYYQFWLGPHRSLNVLDFFVEPTVARHIHLLLTAESKSYGSERDASAVKVSHATHGTCRKYNKRKLSILTV